MTANPKSPVYGAIFVATKKRWPVFGQRAMPTAYHAELRSLRMKYKSASTAHEGCARAIKEAKQRGEEPSPELLEQLAKALLAVTEARSKLLAAMAQAPDGW